VCRIREFPSIEEILKDGCNHYKDKSLCVELPYEVGRVVYVIRSQTSNGENLYMREERISHYRVFHHWVFMCFESERLSVTQCQWETSVFLTKEEAEKKLKEMG
jgi:hypothetical protein